MTKRFQIATVLVMVIVTIGTIAILIFNPNTTDNTNVKGATAPNCTTTAEAEVTLPSGLKYQKLNSCDGAELKEGQTATVNYVGTLTNGTKFDSSIDRGQTFDVVNVGKAQVIEGWNIGLIGMKVGEKRKLTIPPSLGYGAQAQGSIPANSTLIFEVDLIAIK
ncbi:MAG: FKBP-type peptidyl-prolyl cis-trans isomerase [bacterium]